MNTRVIFTLLVLVTLPLAGCIEGSDVAGSLQTGGGAEPDSGTDATNQTTYLTETTIVNNYYNTTTNGSSTAQERTWFSSGGTASRYWSDGQFIYSGQQRCIDYGPTYNQSTGDYEGVACRETGYPSEASDWNLTDCTGNGGIAIWPPEASQGNGSNSYYRYAPSCLTVLKTIQTAPGEALLIYEASGYIGLRTTCEGVSSPLVYSTSTEGIYVSNEHNIVQGSGLSCTHEIYNSRQYASWEGSFDYIWSVVYAIQDTTVV